MRSILLILSVSFILSGCSLFRPSVNIIAGTDDYIDLPKGTLIKDVTLNITGTPQKYDVVLQKSGAFYSVDSQADVLRARAKH